MLPRILAFLRFYIFNFFIAWVFVFHAPDMLKTKLRKLSNVSVTSIERMLGARGAPSILFAVASVFDSGRRPETVQTQSAPLKISVVSGRRAEAWASLVGESRPSATK